MAKVSVIVPVYRSESYLRPCVNSILAQSHNDLELILVDDGSPDGCPAICDEYAKMDSRVRVIHQKNAGVAAARNAGLDAASGEYLAFVDSDDYIESDMYEKMLQIAFENDCDIVLCDCLKESENQSTIYTHDIRKGYYNRKQLREEYFEHLLMMPNVEYPPTISNWVLLFRNTEYVPRYVEGVRYSEDLLFGAQLMYRAQSFYYMKGQCLYHYRMNPQSATHQYVADKWTDYQKLYAHIRASFSSCDDFDFSHQIDLCLLFFVYNAVGDSLSATQFSHIQRVEKAKEILGKREVKEMFSRMHIGNLAVSRKLKIMTWMYKKQIGLGVLSWYLDRKS